MAALLQRMAAIKPEFEMWPRRGEKRCRNEDPPVPQPAQVRERVFLGDADDAMDFERLKRLGITGVLSLPGPSRAPPRATKNHH